MDNVTPITPVKITEFFTVNKNDDEKTVVTGIKSLSEAMEIGEKSQVCEFTGYKSIITRTVTASGFNTAKTMVTHKYGLKSDGETDVIEERFTDDKAALKMLFKAKRNK